MRNPIRTAVMVVALCAIVVTLSFAAERSTNESVAHTLLRSGAVVSTHASKDACFAARTARLQLDAPSKTTGQTRYVCREDDAITVIYGPNSVTPPPPPPPPTAAEWTLCSLEWQRCSFTGTRRVRFGLGTSWVERDLSGGVECGVAAFGDDPAVGQTKRCELRNVTTPPPPPPEPEPTPAGTATLNWTPPTQNADGSALTDLAGFRIHYGRSAAEVTTTVHIANPAVTRHVIEHLSPGTWFFAARAFTATGRESELSNVVQKVVL